MLRGRRDCDDDDDGVWCWRVYTNRGCGNYHNIIPLLK
jgi:hypothetical protein